VIGLYSSAISRKSEQLLVILAMGCILVSVCLFSQSMKFYIIMWIALFALFEEKSKLIESSTTYGMFTEEHNIF
jgi:hypothetical protein